LKLEGSAVRACSQAQMNNQQALACWLFSFALGAGSNDGAGTQDDHREGLSASRGREHLVDWERSERIYLVIRDRACSQAYLSIAELKLYDLISKGIMEGSVMQVRSGVQTYDKCGHKISVENGVIIFHDHEDLRVAETGVTIEKVGLAEPDGNCIVTVYVEAGIH
jgi:hypothetical protein